MHRVVVSMVGLVSVLLFLYSCAPPGQQVLRWAHVYQPTESYHRWALFAAEQIAERTENRYRIEVFPASALGNEAEINEGLTLGTVDLIYTGAAFAGRHYGPIGVPEAPFIFRDFDHWRSYFASDLFTEAKEGYRRVTGHTVVTATYYGMRHVTSNRPINTPEDMRGFKIRVPDAPLYLMFPRAAGANPTPIAFAEVYLALQQGVVDGQENPLPTIQAHHFHEVQSYINLTGHIANSLLIIVSSHVWARLDEGDRLIFSEVLQEAAGRNTEEVYRKEKELLQVFRDQKGITVNPVDREPFRQVVLPELTALDSPWGPELFQRVQELAPNGRAARVGDE